MKEVKEEEKNLHKAPVELIAPEKRTMIQRLKQSILSGGEQTFFCLATDPLEPELNKFFQNNYGDKKEEHHKVTSKMAYVSEFAGDGAAFFAFVGLKTFFSTPINWAINGVRSIATPVLDWRAQRAVKRWATEHKVEEDDPRYKARLEQYRMLGAEQIVDSTIIATSAAALNMLSQRHLMKNEQSYWTMTKGKVGGTLLTFGAMGLTSLLFPKFKHKVEKLVETKLMDPVMNVVRKHIGDDDENAPTITKTAAGQTPSAGIALSPEKREGLLIMVAEHGMKVKWSDPKERAALIGKQKSVYQAFAAVLAEGTPLVNSMIDEHYEVVSEQPTGSFADQLPEARLRNREASRNSVVASAAHKRRDMQQFIALLDDPAFLADVDKVVASGKLPERRHSSITPEQKHYMSETLLKQSGASGLDIRDMAETHALDYQALAQALSPNGASALVLAAELKKQLPSYDPKDIDGIAKDYMGYYQQEALSMSREMDNKGVVVQQALERSEKLRSKYQHPAENSFAMAT